MLGLVRTNVKLLFPKITYRRLLLRDTKLECYISLHRCIWVTCHNYLTIKLIPVTTSLTKR